MDAGDGEPGGGVGGERHVQRLGERGGVGHRGERPDVHGLSAEHLEPCRRVHPCVRDDDEDPGQHAAQRHHDSGEDVRRSTHAIPRVEVDAEEDGFGEEREPFEGEGHAEDGPGELHEAGPEESELEGEDGAGDRADGEEDGGALGPAFGEVEIDPVAGACITPLGDDHEEGQPDSDHREDDVEGQRHGHLAARREQVGHVSI